VPAQTGALATMDLADARDVAFENGAPAAQLLGRGEVVDPWSQRGRSVLCRERVSWTAPQNGRLAVLGSRFLAASRCCPHLMVALHDRLAAQVHGAARYAAIAQLPRVEQRIIALFCALGDDHGHVGASGITVDLELTHETIGRLIGARRPTVSLGLKILAEEGVLGRRRGGWLLSHIVTNSNAARPARPHVRDARSSTSTILDDERAVTSWRPRLTAATVPATVTVDASDADTATRCA